MKKYELTKETINVNNHTLYRIKAVRDFGHVKAGNLGGYIEKEGNLSHDGSAWVNGGACVYGDAYIFGSAQVDGNARVFDDACVCGSVQVFGDAQVSGSARISGDTYISGDACVNEDADVSSQSDYLSISCIGGKHIGITFYKTKSTEIWVNYGFFSGNIDRFLKAVNKTHGKNKYSQACVLACQLAKTQIDLT